MNQSIVNDSKDLINAINSTGSTGPRERLLKIMKLVEEVFIGRILETIPEETGLKS